MKRMTAILLVFSVLTLGLLRPAPAQASVPGAVIIAGVVFGAYLVAVMVATAIVYRRGPLSFQPVPPNADVNRRPPEHGLRFGPRCAPDSGNLTLACW